MRVVLPPNNRGRRDIESSALKFNRFSLTRTFYMGIASMKLSKHWVKQALVIASCNDLKLSYLATGRGKFGSECFLRSLVVTRCNKKGHLQVKRLVTMEEHLVPFRPLFGMA